MMFLIHVTWPSNPNLSTQYLISIFFMPLKSHRLHFQALVEARADVNARDHEGVWSPVNPAVCGCCTVRNPWGKSGKLGEKTGEEPGIFENHMRI